MPPGSRYDRAHGCLLEGGWHERRYRLDETPFFVRPGAVIPGQETCLHLEPGSYQEPVFTLYPGADGQGILYEDDGETLGYRRAEHTQIRCTRTTAQGLTTVTIDPVEGSFPGFIDQRPLTFRFPGRVPPTTVTVDGRSVPFVVDPLGTHGDYWRFDGENICVEIVLRAYSAQQGTAVVLDSLEGIDAGELQGHIGLQRRLKAIARDVARVANAIAFFKDDRLVIRAAQMGR